MYMCIHIHIYLKLKRWILSVGFHKVFDWFLDNTMYRIDDNFAIYKPTKTYHLNWHIKLCYSKTNHLLHPPQYIKPQTPVTHKQFIHITFWWVLDLLVFIEEAIPKSFWFHDWWSKKNRSVVNEKKISNFYSKLVYWYFWCVQ